MLNMENKNQFYKQIIDTIAASVFILEIDENYNTLPIWINKEYEKVIGYSFKERQQIGFATEESGIIHPDDQRFIKKQIQLILTKKKTSSKVLLRINDRNGEWKWIYLTAKPFSLDSDHKLIICNAVDITENLVEDQISLVFNKYIKEITQLRNKLKICKLTKTEKKIIQLLANGYSTREISENKKRSYHTINNHKRNIFRKLNINKLSELVNFAIQNGLN